jgi:hypothetical protein
MKFAHNVRECRWAEQTLQLAAPQWLDAWEFPWSCRASGGFRPIADTRVCLNCQRWLPKDCEDACDCKGECR